MHRHYRNSPKRFFLVSVPFSMGTVLHPVPPSANGISVVSVSVPFSMGTVLHRRQPSCTARSSHRFSPLLDGDGVASGILAFGGTTVCLFQSPSRWGRCCIIRGNAARTDRYCVSVPFSMGTVLHQGKWTPLSRPILAGNKLSFETRLSTLIILLFTKPTTGGGGGLQAAEHAGHQTWRRPLGRRRVCHSSFSMLFQFFPPLTARQRFIRQPAPYMLAGVRYPRLWCSRSWL